MKHICIGCRKEFPSGFHNFCDNCGEMIDVEYDLKNAQLHDSSNPYIRFADLLPITQLHNRLPSSAFTPVIHATRLGKQLGMPSLYLKNEIVLPTRSTKDRMADISLAYLHERGVRSFCTSSTGNSSTAYAHSIQAHPDMHLYLFTAENFVPRVQHAEHSQVTHTGMRDASFVDAFEYSAVYAKENNLVSERGFFNPGRREGLKIAFLEAAEQIPQPIDWYVQAVSSAMGVYGVYKAAKELHAMKRISRLPHVLCVQQETCAPMVNAYSQGSHTIKPEHIVKKPTGIAEAILRGDPTKAYPHVRRIVVESNGGFVAVSEAEIRAARKMVEEHEGISPCFSASATIAGITKLVKQDAFPKNDVVMINLTGGDRPTTPKPANIRWVKPSPQGWVRE
jgi:threonine synthase